MFRLLTSIIRSWYSCNYSFCTSFWWWASTPETCSAANRNIITRSHLVGQLSTLIHDARTHEYKITCTLHEDKYMFLIITHSFLLTMRNISDKSCRENQKTHFLLKSFFSFIFEKSFLLWDNVGKILYSQAGHRWQHGVCVLHAGYLKLKTHTWNMSYVLLFRCNNASMLRCTYVVGLINRLAPELFF